MTIEVPEELALRLETAGIRAGDVSRYALTALANAADDGELQTWWDALSDEERSAERAKTTKSLADADASRCRPAEEVYARARAGAVPQIRG